MNKQQLNEFAQDCENQREAYEQGKLTAAQITCMKEAIKWWNWEVPEDVKNCAHRKYKDGTSEDLEIQNKKMRFINQCQFELVVSIKNKKPSKITICKNEQVQFSVKVPKGCAHKGCTCEELIMEPIIKIFI